MKVLKQHGLMCQVTKGKKIKAIEGETFTVYDVFKLTHTLPPPGGDGFHQYFELLGPPISLFTNPDRILNTPIQLLCKNSLSVLCLPYATIWTI